MIRPGSARTDRGRLDGVPVLVVQGDADTVIPVELRARAWEYLHGDSGAALTAHRSPGGHALTREDIIIVAAWIDEQVGGWTSD